MRGEQYTQGWHICTKRDGGTGHWANERERELHERKRGLKLAILLHMCAGEFIEIVVMGRKSSSTQLSHIYNLPFYREPDVIKKRHEVRSYKYASTHRRHRTVEDP